MGTTVEKLQAILDSKTAIKTAINNKGGTITDSTPLDEYAGEINNLPSSSQDLEKVTNGSIVNLITNVNKIRQYAFFGCIFLETLELTNPSFESIGNSSFNSGVFTTLIIHSTSVAVLNNVNAFPGMMTFTVYVPSNLISSYKTATNWSTLYNNGHITFSAIQ